MTPDHCRLVVKPTPSNSLEPLPSHCGPLHPETLLHRSHPPDTFPADSQSAPADTPHLPFDAQTVATWTLRKTCTGSPVLHIGPTSHLTPPSFSSTYPVSVCHPPFHRASWGVGMWSGYNMVEGCWAGVRLEGCADCSRQAGVSRPVLTLTPSCSLLCSLLHL